MAAHGNCGVALMEVSPISVYVGLVDNYFSATMFNKCPYLNARSIFSTDGKSSGRGGKVYVCMCVSASIGEKKECICVCVCARVSVYEVYTAVIREVKSRSGSLWLIRLAEAQRPPSSRKGLYITVACS